MLKDITLGTENIGQMMMSNGEMDYYNSWLSQESFQSGFDG